jgi:hypothetical protein
MGGLLNKAKRFASSAQGRRTIDRASTYARSEKGKRQIAGLRSRFLGGRKGPKGR